MECYFEKENIWTFDSKCELLLSIISSISQEESHSISENVTWGHRRRMADGKVSVPFGRFLGYDRGEHGELVVNEKEAEIVRVIYKLFLSGLTPHSIAKTLMERGIPTPGGKVKWSSSTVRSILTNEKYKGDALLQKTFTPDYLTKKTKKNDGQIPQYYVEGSHDGIITPEIFEAVQAKMERRKGNKSRYSGVDILASKLICGECGGFYSPKVWHSTDQYRRTIYQCGHKYKGECKCSTPNLTAEEIQSAFLSAANELITNKNEIIANLREGMVIASDTTELEKSRDAAKDEMVLVSDMIENLISENARIAQNQAEYNKKYNTLIERFEAAKTQYESFEQQIEDTHRRVKRIEAFMTTPQYPDIQNGIKKNFRQERREHRIVFNFHSQGALNQAVRDFLSARYRFAKANIIFSLNESYECIPRYDAFDFVQKFFFAGSGLSSSSFIMASVSCVSIFLLYHVLYCFAIVRCCLHSGAMKG